MRLIISSPDSMLLDVPQVDWINIRLADGSLISIYANHAPLIALHAACKIKYRIENQVFEKQIPEGVLSISENTVRCWISGSSKISTDKDKDEEIITE